MKQHTAKAIVLKKSKYGEADLIVRVLTNEGAKIALMARGALKSKKRFAGGVLEPTHFVSISYKESKTSTGLFVLEEASLIKDFKNLRTDYDRLEIALYFLNIIEKISQEGDAHAHDVFNLLGNSLSVLENAKQIQLLKVQFALKLLHQQGVLTYQDWMTPFLKISTKEIDTINIDQIPSDDIYIDFKTAFYTLDQYIKTATT